MVDFTHLNIELSNAPIDVLTGQDVRWLNWAFDLAQTSKRDRNQLGAVIIYRGKIVGYGVNTCKTHPFQRKTNQRSSELHAEIVALLMAQKTDYDPQKSIIYVARSRRNTPACSYPCEYCWPTVLHVGISTVVCYDKMGIPCKITTP